RWCTKGNLFKLALPSGIILVFVIKEHLSFYSLVFISSMTFCCVSLIFSLVGSDNNSWIKYDILMKSSSLKPFVVIAGDPKRIPDVYIGFSSSKGMAFLLIVIFA